MEHSWHKTSTDVLSLGQSGMGLIDTTTSVDGSTVSPHQIAVSL